VAIFSFEAADVDFSTAFGYVLATISILILVIYVAVLSRFKFQRIKEQNEQFKKIKILTSNYELEVGPQYAELFKEQQAERDFIQGKEGAMTSQQINMEKVYQQMMTPNVAGREEYKGIPELTPRNKQKRERKSTMGK